MANFPVKLPKYYGLLETGGLFHDLRYYFHKQSELGVLMCTFRHIILLLIIISSVGTIGMMAGAESVFAAVEIDPVSAECLSCHDNIDESEMRFHRGHVTGIAYEDYLDREQDFRNVSSLPQEMVLHEGKITCVTCHGVDPHDDQFLVIDNSGSALCVSCHKR